MRRRSLLQQSWNTAEQNRAFLATTDIEGHWALNIPRYQTTEIYSAHWGGAYRMVNSTRGFWGDAGVVGNVQLADLGQIGLSKFIVMITR